jgi:hypothetical protein
MKITFSRLIAGLVVLAAVGYLSNVLSATSCEREVARWIMQDIMKGEGFFVVPGRAQRSLTAFNEVGARVEVYASKTGNFHGFPWGEVGEARFRWPFLVSVKWGYVQEPLSGEGGVRQFLCLFGYPIKLGDKPSWST